MKKFLRNAYLLFKGFGYARAAAFHARQGDHRKATQIMEEYSRCK
jgi:hypothetical protein